MLLGHPGGCLQLGFDFILGGRGLQVNSHLLAAGQVVGQDLDLQGRTCQGRMRFVDRNLRDAGRGEGGVEHGMRTLRWHWRTLTGLPPSRRELWCTVLPASRPQAAREYKS